MVCPKQGSNYNQKNSCSNFAPYVMGVILDKEAAHRDTLGPHFQSSKMVFHTQDSTGSQSRMCSSLLQLADFGGNRAGQMGNRLCIEDETG